MKDFIQAAAPFVLCGIAVAIICARLGGKKGQKSQGFDNGLEIGLALGLMLAPAFNSIGLWENRSIGFALCPLWGMALASLRKRKEESDEKQA